MATKKASGGGAVWTGRKWSTRKRDVVRSGGGVPPPPQPPPTAGAPSKPAQATDPNIYFTGSPGTGVKTTVGGVVYQTYVTKEGMAYRSVSRGGVVTSTRLYDPSRETIILTPEQQKQAKTEQLSGQEIETLAQQEQEVIKGTEPREFAASIFAQQQRSFEVSPQGLWVVGSLEGDRKAYYTGPYATTPKAVVPVSATYQTGFEKYLPPEAGGYAKPRPTFMQEIAQKLVGPARKEFDFIPDKLKELISAGGFKGAIASYAAKSAIKQSLKQDPLRSAVSYGLARFYMSSEERQRVRELSQAGGLKGVVAKFEYTYEQKVKPYVYAADIAVRESIREHPIRELVTFGVSYGVGFGLKALQLAPAYIKSVTTAKKVYTVQKATKRAGVVIGAAYGTAQTVKFVRAPTPEAKGAVLGETALEVGTFGVGMKAGAGTLAAGVRYLPTRITGTPYQFFGEKGAEIGGPMEVHLKKGKIIKAEKFKPEQFAEKLVKEGRLEFIEEKGLIERTGKTPEGAYAGMYSRVIDTKTGKIVERPTILIDPSMPRTKLGAIVKGKIERLDTRYKTRQEIIAHELLHRQYPKKAEAEIEALTYDTKFFKTVTRDVESEYFLDDLYIKQTIQPTYSVFETKGLYEGARFKSRTTLIGKEMITISNLGAYTIISRPQGRLIRHRVVLGEMVVKEFKTEAPPALKFEKTSYTADLKRTSYTKQSELKPTFAKYLQTKKAFYEADRLISERHKLLPDIDIIERAEITAETKVYTELTAKQKKVEIGIYEKGQLSFYDLKTIPAKLVEYTPPFQKDVFLKTKEGDILTRIDEIQSRALVLSKPVKKVFGSYIYKEKPIFYPRIKGKGPGIPRLFLGKKGQQAGILRDKILELLQDKPEPTEIAAPKTRIQLPEFRGLDKPLLKQLARPEYSFLLKPSVKTKVRPSLKEESLIGTETKIKGRTELGTRISTDIKAASDIVSKIYTRTRTPTKSRAASELATDISTETKVRTELDITPKIVTQTKQLTKTGGETEVPIGITTETKIPRPIIGAGLGFPLPDISFAIRRPRRKAKGRRYKKAYFSIPPFSDPKSLYLTELALQRRATQPKDEPKERKRYMKLLRGEITRIPTIEMMKGLVNVKSLLI